MVFRFVVLHRNLRIRKIRIIRLESVLSCIGYKPIMVLIIISDTRLQNACISLEINNHIETNRVHVEANNRWPLIDHKIWPIESVRRLDTCLPPPWPLGNRPDNHHLGHKLQLKQQPATSVGESWL